MFPLESYSFLYADSRVNAFVRTCRSSVLSSVCAVVFLSFLVNHSFYSLFQQLIHPQKVNCAWNYSLFLCVMLKIRASFIQLQTWYTTPSYLQLMWAMGLVQKSRSFGLRFNGLFPPPQASLPSALLRGASIHPWLWNRNSACLVSAQL